MDSIYILKKPLVTERTTVMNEQNRYAFEVATTATKPQIKEAVERLYKVRVVGVNTQVRQNRTRRMKYGVVPGKTWKMAVVRLHAEDRIELFS